MRLESNRVSLNSSVNVRISCGVDFVQSVKEM